MVQRYAWALTLLSVPLVALSLLAVPAARWPFLLLCAIAYAALCTRTMTLPSGMIITGAGPLATAGMILFQPMEAYALVLMGMIVVGHRGRRPLPRTLANITAVGSGLAAGSWFYHAAVTSLGLAGEPLLARLLPFLLAMLIRELVNHALIAPVVGAAQGGSPLDVLRNTAIQKGFGHLALDATGLAFADLILRDGTSILVYIMLVLVGTHQAISFWAKRSELQWALEHDGLTLARNRYALDQVSRRADWSGHLVVIDCDNMKLINDTRGHQAGDQMLQTLARKLMNAVGSEQVFRYGGDEFVVLVPELRGLTRVRAAIAEVEQECIASVSIGVCNIPAEAADLSAGFALADQRMYAVKASRRRLVWASDENRFTL